MIEAIRYEASRSAEWDRHIRKARNGSFLFLRDYMDYHADRFCDHSLMFYRGTKLLGVLPASAYDKLVASHGGLTYGGFILSEKAHAVDVKEMMEASILYYKSLGYEELELKPVPHIYHNYPSDDELYWLFRNKAQIAACGLSSAINLDHPQEFSTLRKRKVNKAHRAGYQVVTDANLEQLPDFWSILEQVLEKNHSRRPVHTLEEIQLLQRRFPDKIRLATVTDSKGEVVAGTLLYFVSQVIHAQYIASSPTGAQNGALDLLFSTLIAHYSTSEYRYFDFGISTESGGAWLNEGLNFQKEGFGARSVVYNIYHLSLT